MILFDANVFVDVLNNRDNFYEASAEVIEKVQSGKESGCISALTVPILWYVLGEDLPPVKEIREIINDFEIIPLTSQIIEASFKSEMKDFEDAIQLNSALKRRCTTLITRNKKDFKINTISILTPEEFLASDKD